jgi:hypothetical protein
MRRARQREHEQAVEQDDRAEPGELQAPLEQRHHRPQDEGEDAGRGDGPDDAGELADKPAERHEDEAQQTEGRHDGAKPQGEADEAALGGGEQRDVGFGHAGRQAVRCVAGKHAARHAEFPPLTAPTQAATCCPEERAASGDNQDA